MYQEQLHQHELILQEAQKTSHNHARAVSQLEVLNESRRQVENTTDTLKMELAKAKVGNLGIYRHVFRTLMLGIKFIKR